MKKLRLEDLTKEELIKIIRRHLVYSLTQNEMRWLRRESLVEKSQRLSQEAIDEMKKYSVSEDWKNVRRYFEASAKFDRAMKLWDQADALVHTDTPKCAAGELTPRGEQRV